tara:strand:- start:44159 stop:44398 length:240 start_codon:yes stop_codon:yes gene_type:complete
MKKSLYSKRHKALIRVLKEAREAAGLTQQAVADKLGKPQSFVAKYENGERRLDVVEFLWVTEALGVAANLLLDEIREAN